MWDLVITDMKDRDNAGFKKYGTRLRSRNGRDALVDGYQECLDMAVYLRQKIEEDSRLHVDLHAAFIAMRKDGEGLTLSQEQAILKALGWDE